MPDLLMNERSAFVRGAVRRVLSPAEPQGHLFVCDFRGEDKLIYADAGGFRRLALAANVAASDANHLVYLPAGSLWPYGHFADEKAPPLGLVFSHPHTGFRPSDWKDLRGRLGPAVPVRKRAEFRQDHGASRWQDELGDPRMVDIAIHATTMFVTTGAHAFRALARGFADAAESGHQQYHAFEHGVSLRDGHRRLRGRDMEIECITWTHWI
jgi:hypothetical protein